MSTPICRQLGIEHPVFLAGMGVGIAGPELAAAVSNAGGCGVLGMGALLPDFIREQIRATRALTDKPIGVNLLLPLLEPGALEVCLEERPSFLVLFWGDPTAQIAAAHAAGVSAWVQVGSVAQAREAVAAGADAIIAQGVEAGGHVRGTTALSVLLPAVVAAVHPVPVIAAGGIADARGLKAALALGAQGVSVGTRFLASDEANAAPEYKQRLIAAGAEDTVHTELFDLGWPEAAHRVLRNSTYSDWEAAGSPASGQRPQEGAVVGRMPVAGETVDVLRYMVLPPMPGFEGDLEATALYAGQCVESIHDIRPARDIVRSLVS